MVKQKILIVEDEEPMARALQHKLENEGFDADVAENGKEALDRVAKTQYDVILLDLIMPEMDGFTFLQELQTKTYTAKIIVSTNLSQQEDMEHVKELGVDDYFVKSDTPITEVVKHVKKTLS